MAQLPSRSSQTENRTLLSSSSSDVSLTMRDRSQLMGRSPTLVAASFFPFAVPAHNHGQAIHAQDEDFVLLNGEQSLQSNNKNSELDLARLNFGRSQHAGTIDKPVNNLHRFNSLDISGDQHIINTQILDSATANQQNSQNKFHQQNNDLSGSEQTPINLNGVNQIDLSDNQHIPNSQNLDFTTANRKNFQNNFQQNKNDLSGADHSNNSQKINTSQDNHSTSRPTLHTSNQFSGQKPPKTPRIVDQLNQGLLDIAGDARIVRSWSNTNSDGTFNYGYINSDGSYKNETRGNDCVVRGVYGYVDRDSGVTLSFPYTSGNPCSGGPSPPPAQNALIQRVITVVQQQPFSSTQDPSQQNKQQLDQNQQQPRRHQMLQQQQHKKQQLEEQQRLLLRHQQQELGQHQQVQQRQTQTQRQPRILTEPQQPQLQLPQKPRQQLQQDQQIFQQQQSIPTRQQQQQVIQKQQQNQRHQPLTPEEFRRRHELHEKQLEIHQQQLRALQEQQIQQILQQHSHFIPKQLQQHEHQVLRQQPQQGNKFLHQLDANLHPTQLSKQTQQQRPTIQQQIQHIPQQQVSQSKHQSQLQQHQQLQQLQRRQKQHQEQSDRLLALQRLHQLHQETLLRLHEQDQAHGQNFEATQADHNRKIQQLQLDKQQELLRLQQEQQRLHSQMQAQQQQQLIQQLQQQRTSGQQTNSLFSLRTTHVPQAG